MKQAIIFFLIFTVSFHAPAQPPEEIILPVPAAPKKECSEVFTKMTVPPSLKKGIRSFEDSLTGLLKEKRLFANGTNTVFTFIINLNGNVIELRTTAGSNRIEIPVKISFMHTRACGCPLLKTVLQFAPSFVCRYT